MPGSHQVSRRAALRIGVAGAGTLMWSAPTLLSAANAAVPGSPVPSDNHSPSTSVSPSTAGSETPSPTATTSVLPTKLTKTPTPSPTTKVKGTKTTRGVHLPGTGVVIDTADAVALAAALVGTGVVATTAGRRLAGAHERTRPQREVPDARLLPPSAEQPPGDTQS